MELFKRLFGKPAPAGENITSLPVHVAIIMDGNGRWAQRRGLPRSAGHRAGMERIREIVRACRDYGVKYLTIYAFSTENWRRPQEEVSFLMSLFQEALKNQINDMHREDVKIRFIGLKQNLHPDLVREMERAEKLTAENEAITLNVALNYGGRAELTAAIKGIAHAVKQGKLTPEAIDDEQVAAHLFTAGQPDPDLLIRPGGEQRVSNFLIWQTAYSELYFSDLYWPDFNQEELAKAFRYFSQRERRFGRVKGGPT